MRTFFRVFLNFAAAALTLLVWTFRWKASVLSMHRAALDLGRDQGRGSGRGFTPTLSDSGFRLRWTFRLSQVLVRFLTGAPLATPIHVRPRDLGKLHRLRSHPTLFLTGHFGDWEALAAWMSSQAIPLLGAARPLQSPWADALLHRLRLRRRVPVLTSDILPGAMAHLRSGRCFGILWDQFSPLSRHHALLFGISAAMDPLPEILVRRLAPEVWVGFLLPSGQLRLLPIHPPGSPLPDPSRLSRRYHRVLELVVRAHPTHWIGLCHRRFKGALPYSSSRDVSRETIRSKSQSSHYVSRETIGDIRQG